MQILTERWVRVFQLKREGVSCLSEVRKILYSCHGSQNLPSVVRQELWSAFMLLLLFRSDLRAPVDLDVMASVFSLAGGAICRFVGLTARSLGASRLSEWQQKILSGDEVLFICINDNLGAGRDPSCWNWELLHIWKWEHSGRISQLQQRYSGGRGRHHFCAHRSCCSLTINHPLRRWSSRDKR